MNTKKKGFTTRIISTIRGKTHSKLQRYYCNDCQHSFTSQGYNKRKSFSSDLKEKVILDYVLTKSSLSETGQRYNVSKSSICNWIIENSAKFSSINKLPMYQKTSGYIQFDGKFPTIAGTAYCLLHASDAHTNEPICYGLYRREDTEATNTFLKMLKRIYPSEIKGIISDFGKGRCFIKPIEQLFPEALHQICIVHYLRYVSMFLPRSKRSQYFIRNRFMKGLIRNMLRAPDRSESEFWYLLFNHFIPFFKADYHKRFIRSITKHYSKLTAFYEDEMLISNTNMIENRNRQLERKLKNIDGFGAINNAKKFLQIWFHFQKMKYK